MKRVREARLSAKRRLAAARNRFMRRNLERVRPGPDAVMLRSGHCLEDGIGQRHRFLPAAFGVQGDGR